MNIVVLDGYTLNPGDLNWDAFAALGSLVIHDRTPPDLTISRAQGSPVILTNKTLLTREVIDALPDLRYIGVLATGYNVVDLAAAAERGICVTNVPAYSTLSVAQHTFALLLTLCNHVHEHSLAVRQGEWSSCADFTFRKTPLLELAGKKLGIIGFGDIGRQVAAIGQTLGMDILAYNRSDIGARLFGGRPTLPDPAAVRQVPLAALLAESDVISLHCALTPQTEGIIRAEHLALMKKTALLINTARGPLVVDQDLADALAQGQIAGAGLDVLSQEPPQAGNPLLQAPNCIITPHIAWASLEARTRLMNSAAHNLKCFLEGQPVNVVST